MRLSRRALAATAAAAVLVLGGSTALAVSRHEPAVRTEVLKVAGVPEPAPGGGTVPVTLDATLYLPETSAPAPAVLLAHGFGGSKADLDEDARLLAQEGYVALAYSARGFGASGGLVHVDAPDYEVADARKLLDVLAARPEVLKDAPGDPRVGVVGGSYGGALTLLLAGYDHRVDAIAPQITWNDLPQALFPQFAGPSVADTAGASTPAAVAGRGDSSQVSASGVFKKAWAGLFFGAGGSGSRATPTPSASGGAPSRLPSDPDRPRRAAPSPAGAGSRRTSATPTSAPPPPGNPPRRGCACSRPPARRRSSTASRRRRSSCRVRRTRCSRCPRATPTRPASPRTAPR